MTPSQTLCAVLGIVLGGEPIVNWIADNRLFFGTIALLAIGVLFAVNVFRANRAK